MENPTTYTFQQPQPKIDVRKKLKDGIGKRILRRLLSECDYFEMLREENPMVYDSIRTQLKYFNPTFHSTTPEGLNSRLTFLNQCVRPGETIPVIDPDGRPKYNDALNTSFGTPPVLILRIGDFYHTKIIPKGLTISYDPLVYDMNPEGIGLQPMIAKVSLSFDFIGGHGLAKPVEQLQNALSFNYYANTEIYDERAVWTEDTSALDRQIFEDLFGKEILQEVDDTQKPPERRGGKTIGDIATTVPVTGGETGFTTFQKVTDSALTNSKDYFTTLYNTADKICKQYNWGIWQLLCNERNYTEGNFLLADNIATTPPQQYKVEIFGKPENVEQKIQYLFEQTLIDIKTGINNFIMKKMSEGNLFLPADIERLRVNYEEYLSTYYINYAPPLFDAIQTFTIFQQDMVQNFRKLNVVNSRTDGKILDNGTPFVYSLDSTNEVTQQGQFTSIVQNTIEELRIDYQALGIKYNDFKQLTELTNTGIVNVNYPKDKANAGNFLPLTLDLASRPIQDKRLFMSMSSIFADDAKLLEFKEFLLRQGLKQVNKFEIQLTKACEEFRLIVKAELDAQVVYFKKFKDSQEFINFEKNDTFPPNKVRKFKYTTVKNPGTLPAQEKLVKDVWSDVNVTQDNKKTWDGKIRFD